MRPQHIVGLHGGCHRVQERCIDAFALDSVAKNRALYLCPAASWQNEHF